jgi:uncharacterized protein YdbL (DUF1318 family)
MKRHILGFAVAALAALSLAGSAVAMDTKAAVDQAKAQGVVGEQADGFLGFVKPTTDSALKAAVQEINQGRAALYREAAQKNGVSVEAAGAAAYNQVVQIKLKPGEYYRPAGGGWVRK